MNTRAYRTILVAALMGAVWTADAREPEDCMQSWGQAVRSYLTQNRTAGPEDEAFSAACRIEAAGDKAGARVEAIMIGTKALARLDDKGCQRFLGRYVGIQNPRGLCDASSTETDAELRKRIELNLPPPKK